MKHVLSALVIMVALFVMSNLAAAQCCQTACYAPASDATYDPPASYATYYAPALYTTYYAAQPMYYSPVVQPYYTYRPWWGCYRYYGYRPVTHYYGW